MYYAQLNGLRTRYYVSGQGPDVLFVHGWAASGRMWLRSMYALRRHFRTWAVDLAGFGDSDNPGEGWYSLERCTNYIADFCTAMGIQPSTVVGHSLGGRVALDLALRYPELAERVVAVSPTITGRLGLNLDVILMGRVGETLLSLSQRIWPLAEASVMTQVMAPRYLNTECVTRASNDLRRASGDAVVGSLRALVNQDFSPNLPRIGQPALVITGERDTTVPPSDARLAAELMPNAELVTLKGVHHMPSDEAPRHFSKLVSEFASRESIDHE